LFFDRQWLLRLLYDNLKHKDRVLLNMNVTKVERIDGGIQVTAENGKVVKGSIVVGADGVHSAVREQMVRMGEAQQPGYFPPGMLDRVPCYYRCSFGIAQHVKGYMRGQQNNVRAKNWSGLVLSGPEDKVYWFLFDRLPKPEYGKDIPRYTKEDEARFVRHPLTPTPTASQSLTIPRIDLAICSLCHIHDVAQNDYVFLNVMNIRIAETRSRSRNFGTLPSRIQSLSARYTPRSFPLLSRRYTRSSTRNGSSTA
jgi:hypothetical protein